MFLICDFKWFGEMSRSERCSSAAGQHPLRQHQQLLASNFLTTCFLLGSLLLLEGCVGFPNQPQQVPLPPSLETVIPSQDQGQSQNTTIGTVEDEAEKSSSKLLDHPAVVPLQMTEDYASTKSVANETIQEPKNSLELSSEETMKVKRYAGGYGGYQQPAPLGYPHYMPPAPMGYNTYQGQQLMSFLIAKKMKKLKKKAGKKKKRTKDDEGGGGDDPEGGGGEGGDEPEEEGGGGESEEEEPGDSEEIPVVKKKDKHRKPGKKEGKKQKGKDKRDPSAGLEILTGKTGVLDMDDAEDSDEVSEAEAVDIFEEDLESAFDAPRKSRARRKKGRKGGKGGKGGGFLGNLVKKGINAIKDLIPGDDEPDDSSGNGEPLHGEDPNFETTEISDAEAFEILKGVVELALDAPRRGRGRSRKARKGRKQGGETKDLKNVLQDVKKIYTTVTGKEEPEEPAKDHEPSSDMQGDLENAIDLLAETLGTPSVLDAPRSRSRRRRKGRGKLSDVSNKEAAVGQIRKIITKLMDQLEDPDQDAPAVENAEALAEVSDLLEDAGVGESEALEIFQDAIEMALDAPRRGRGRSRKARKGKKQGGDKELKDVLQDVKQIYKSVTGKENPDDPPKDHEPSLDTEGELEDAIDLLAESLSTHSALDAPRSRSRRRKKGGKKLSDDSNKDAVIKQIRRIIAMLMDELQNPGGSEDSPMVEAAEVLEGIEDLLEDSGVSETEASEIFQDAIGSALDAPRRSRPRRARKGKKQDGGTKGLKDILEGVKDIHKLVTGDEPAANTGEGELEDALTLLEETLNSPALDAPKSRAKRKRKGGRSKLSDKSNKDVVLDEVRRIIDLLLNELDDVNSNSPGVETSLDIGEILEDALAGDDFLASQLDAVDVSDEELEDLLEAPTRTGARGRPRKQKKKKPNKKPNKKKPDGGDEDPGELNDEPSDAELAEMLSDWLSESNKDGSGPQSVHGGAPASSRSFDALHVPDHRIPHEFVMPKQMENQGAPGHRPSGLASWVSEFGKTGMLNHGTKYGHFKRDTSSLDILAGNPELLSPKVHQPHARSIKLGDDLGEPRIFKSKSDKPLATGEELCRSFNIGCGCRGRVSTMGPGLRDKSRVCDGICDCPTCDDETGCYSTNTDGKVELSERDCLGKDCVQCPSLYWSCAVPGKHSNDPDMSCYSIEQRCDGVVDCPGTKKDEDVCFKLDEYSTRSSQSSSGQLAHTGHAVTTTWKSSEPTKTQGFLYRMVGGKWNMVCDSPWTMVEDLASDLCRKVSGKQKMDIKPTVTTMPHRGESSQDFLHAITYVHFQDGSWKRLSSCKVAYKISCPSLSCGSELNQFAVASSWSGTSKRTTGPLKDTPERRHPWVVSIFKDGKHKCEGVLINSKWILTAAQCFVDRDVKLVPVGAEVQSSFYEVRAGAIRLNSASPFIQIRDVASIMIHELYSGLRDTSDEQRLNDIAMVMIDKPFEFNAYVSCASLPSQGTQLENDTPCYIAGWGLHTAEKALESDSLTEMEVKVAKPCPVTQERLQKFVQVCVRPAGHIPKHLASLPYARSGGPLICKVDDGTVLAGIATYKNGSIQLSETGTFTTVTTYLTWINEVLDKAHTVEYNPFMERPTKQCPTFRCSDGRCTAPGQKCDGIFQCPVHGEDEISGCL